MRSSVFFDANSAAVSARRLVQFADNWQRVGFEKIPFYLPAFAPLSEGSLPRSTCMRPQLMHLHHEIKEKDLVPVFHLTEDLVNTLFGKDDEGIYLRAVQF